MYLFPYVAIRRPTLTGVYKTRGGSVVLQKPALRLKKLSAISLDTYVWLFCQQNKFMRLQPPHLLLQSLLIIPPPVLIHLHAALTSEEEIMLLLPQNIWGTHLI